MAKKFILWLAALLILSAAGAQVFAQEKNSDLHRKTVQSHFKIGDKVDVEWEGDWYPAKVMETDKAKYYISYDNYGSEWNEWVSNDRIRKRSLNRLYIGKEVQVEWQGSWFHAIILRKAKGKYFIHYIGYSNNDDEWVARERIRPLPNPDSQT